MKVFFANSSDDARRWQQYVEDNPDCTHYHRWGWKQVIETSFRWPTYFLMAEEEGQVVGILPLALQSSRIFGRFLTSLPFLNGGGPVARTGKVEEDLVAAAIVLAQELRADHMELRYRREPQPGNLRTKMTKVAVVRPVEADEDKMLRDLPHKVRTDVRKAMKSDFTAELVGETGLDDFYRIFSVNMRNLGTPAYSRNFFQEMLNTFPAETYICVIRHHGKPVAASFLMGFRRTIEAGWSSSLQEYLALKPNVFLYWSIFCLTGARGYRTFDFGRSSVGSGTHRFKMQWGSQEIPLYWAYWLPDGASLPELNPQNPRYRVAIWLWKHLPVSLTTWAGPRIVRCLP
ncbi:MAG: FemAB family XrtA/PEP-CTERM system-associated protein [Acidobacteriota bacterium]